jgi:hypothetical protein
MARLREQPYLTFFFFCYILRGFVKFGGQSIFDVKDWVLDGFILGINWQWL